LLAYSAVLARGGGGNRSGLATAPLIPDLCCGCDPSYDVGLPENPGWYLAAQ